MQVFRVFQTGVDELFELAVDFWHKLGEGKLLGERKLEETEQKKIKKLRETSPDVIPCAILHKRLN